MVLGTWTGSLEPPAPLSWLSHYTFPYSRQKGTESSFSERMNLIPWLGGEAESARTELPPSIFPQSPVWAASYIRPTCTAPIYHLGSGIHKPFLTTGPSLNPLPAPPICPLSFSRPQEDIASAPEPNQKSQNPPFFTLHSQVSPRFCPAPSFGVSPSTTVHSGHWVLPASLHQPLQCSYWLQRERLHPQGTSSMP